jgi:hypothetical protein
MEVSDFEQPSSGSIRHHSSGSKLSTGINVLPKRRFDKLHTIDSVENYKPL